MTLVEACKAVDGMLTPAEVGRLLGITSQRVVQLADERRLTCYRSRFGRLFHPCDVDDFARERETAKALA